MKVQILSIDMYKKNGMQEFSHIPINEPIKLNNHANIDGAIQPKTQVNTGCTGMICYNISNPYLFYIIFVKMKLNVLANRHEKKGILLPILPTTLLLHRELTPSPTPYYDTRL